MLNNIQNNRELVVLGVDPGCIVAGFSVVTLLSGRAALLEHGVLKMSSGAPLCQRIKIFHDFFEEKIQAFPVTVLALETPFLGKNAQNFLKLGYLRGILHLLQARHGLELSEFSPSQVKKTITGHGGAEKEQVARLLLRLFPNLVMPDRLDETDAIAVGLCGAWSYRPNVLHRINLK